MDEFVAACALGVSERTVAIAGTAIRANFRCFRIPGKAFAGTANRASDAAFRRTGTNTPLRLPSRNLTENPYQSREIIGCHRWVEQRSKGELNHGGNFLQVKSSQ